MKLEDLKCICNNVNLDDYYELYTRIRKQMNHPEWLGLIDKEDMVDLLNEGAKIWLYYDHDMAVCSVSYLPTENKGLRKHNINYDEKLTGALGPIFVDEKYHGNGLMNEMLKVLEDYVILIGQKYIFTKAAKDNIYSTRVIEKNNYKITHEYENERGMNQAFLKEIER